MPGEAAAGLRWRPASFAEHPAKKPKVLRRGIGGGVVDGDTLDVLIELGLDTYQYVRLRLAFVDAPEIFHPTSDAERALGLKAKAAVEALTLNLPLMIDVGTESEVQNRFIASVAYWDAERKVWGDLRQYLTDHKLLKSDVSP
jgi:endonuclease YncB( thermonuclease family)